MDDDALTYIFCDYCNMVVCHKIIYMDTDSKVVKCLRCGNRIGINYITNKK